MESSSLYRVGSLRQNGSSMWRNTGEDVFSRSSKDDDDEEALKWAALEKLPAYDRIRKGIMLTAVTGEYQEVEVKKLGFQERKNLVERLIRVAEEDNEKFLWKLKSRMDRVGIANPTIEVRFENLNVEAETYVGSRALPTIPNFIFNTIVWFLSDLHVIPSQKQSVPVLHNLSGIIKPSRMALLLGPPGSGKTTLLLALAGKLDKELKMFENLYDNI